MSKYGDMKRSHTWSFKAWTGIVLAASTLPACSNTGPRKITPIYQVVGEVEEAARELDRQKAAQAPQGQTAAKPPGETLPDVLRMWVGKDVNPLIERLGVPKRDFKMPNGSMLYEFVNEGPPRVIAVQSGDVYQNITFPQYCRITVTANKKSEVTNASWVGNMCN